MSDYVTKKELEVVLDEKFDKYQAAILEAVGNGFAKVDAKFDKIDARFDGIDLKFVTIEEELETAGRERVDIQESINRLANTLDAFLKRLTNFEDEFTILKAEVAQMKHVLKEKFNIDISLQGK